jgi:hypothetical protein
MIKSRRTVSRAHDDRRAEHDTPRPISRQHQRAGRRVAQVIVHLRRMVDPVAADRRRAPLKRGELRY